MRTCAVLPVKHFDDAKQRLDKALNAGTRRALAEAMVCDVLHALRRSTRIDAVIVVTGEHAAEALARAYDAEAIPDDDRGHSHAARSGVDWALERGFERVLMVPGDCPTLDAAELDELVVEGMSPPDVVIVPDRHGTGTNALLLAPPEHATRRPRPPPRRAGASPSRARSCSTSTPPRTSRCCAPHSTRARAAPRTPAAS